MKYSVAIKKDFRYIKTYKLVKKVNDNSNAISTAFQKLVDKYLLKKAPEETR